MEHRHSYSLLSVVYKAINDKIWMNFLPFSSPTPIWGIQVSDFNFDFFFSFFCKFVQFLFMPSMYESRELNKKSSNFLPFFHLQHFLNLFSWRKFCAVFCFWFLFLDMMSSSYSHRGNIYTWIAGRMRFSAAPETEVAATTKLLNARKTATVEDRFSCNRTSMCA